MNEKDRKELCFSGTFPHWSGQNWHQRQHFCRHGVGTEPRPEQPRQQAHLRRTNHTNVTVLKQGSKRANPMQHLNLKKQELVEHTQT